MDYVLHLLALIGIYAMLGISLNLIAGCTGLLSVSHAALFGVGAYSVAIATRAGMSFGIAALVGAIVAGIIAVAIAVTSLRVKDDHFVIASFVFQVIFFQVVNNWTGFTGGAAGIAGIPTPVILGTALAPRGGMISLILLLTGLTWWCATSLTRTRLGLVLRVIREDEILASTFGNDVPAAKVAVFVLGGVMASVAGALYASYLSFIDPTSFTVTESIFLLSIVILGGAGSMRGSVAAAALLVILPEALRFLGLPSVIAANVRQLLYGSILVVLMLFRPRGVLGEYSFGSAKYE